MSSNPKTFGTLLRHLLELVDGGVEHAYRELGLDYRPRYTPIVRAIRETGPASIRTLARQAGITHSAVSQTVAHMAQRGLLELVAGEDGRERIVRASAKLQAMVPLLERQWRANNAVGAELDAELSAPLSKLLAEAIEALEAHPMSERLIRAAGQLGRKG